MRKIVLGLAAMALIFTSCSKDEVTGVNEQNPDVIGFFSSTSRATVANLATLQGDATGFKVYGTSTASSSGWFTGISGAVNYRYNSGWGWATGAPQWPTVATEYPMNFYAMYPAAPAGVVPSASAISQIDGAVTIQATAAAQVDLLAAKATATAKPGDGKLPLTFNHILSKVNFGVIAGNLTSPFVQSIGVKNVYNAATYDYVVGAWKGTPAPVGVASYEYFKSTAVPFTTTGTAAEAPVAILSTSTTPTAAAGNLMLLPQTHATWDKTAATLASGSFVEMIYRLTAPGAPNSIGYTAATDYLVDYPATIIPAWGTAPNNYSGIGTGGGQYSSKLFVKVGFPFAATNFTWAPGKGYTYNIGLGTSGSSNGYYTDDTYYDEHGQDTGIPVVGKKIGDPVSDGIIHFLVNVTNWDDLTPIDLP